MNRGDVYLMSLMLPDRDGGVGRKPRDKYVVLLQGDPEFAETADVALVVASTYRQPKQVRVRPYNVVVDESDGFERLTVIDCRWPFTVMKSEVRKGQFKFRLSEKRMRQVSLALVHGLQLGAGGPPQPSR